MQKQDAGMQLTARRILSSPNDSIGDLVLSIYLKTRFPITPRE
jgi:hypothetical protein